MTAFKPEAQTLFTNVQVTSVEQPAPKATCLSGA
jgi:hypothetical protein